MVAVKGQAVGFRVDIPRWERGQRKQIKRRRQGTENKVLFFGFLK